MASFLKSLTADLTITQYSDWLIFVERLNKAIGANKIKQIPALRPAWGPGERWFLDHKTNEIYACLSPNPPTLPRWEQVDVFKQLESSYPALLSTFKVGAITVMMAHIMKLKLEEFVSQGLIEELSCPTSSTLRKDETERRFRDLQSNTVYRLREYYGLKDPDDLRWEIVPAAELAARIQ
jgi:hypothetical protein